MGAHRHIQSLCVSLLLGLFIGMGVSLSAQSLEVETSLDTNRIMIGEQVALTLRVEKPQNLSVRFPFLVDSLETGVEVIASMPLDTIPMEDGQEILSQQFILTSFDSGPQLVPALPIMYGDSDTTYSKRLAFEVFMVQADTSAAFRAIKGPVNVPLTFWDIFKWVLLGLLIVGLIIGGIYLALRLKNREKPEPIAPAPPPEPVIPPHVVALTEFEKLREKALWQSGHIKEYHSQVTEILRTYIEKRYGILALERTSDEILQSFRDKGSTSNIPFMELKQILSLADFVKFAKAKPLAEENEQSLSNAIRFVRETAVKTHTPPVSKEIELPPVIAVEPEQTADQPAEEPEAGVEPDTSDEANGI